MARSATAILCIALIAPGGSFGFVNPQQSVQSTTSPQAAKVPAEQLDSLVAPIALYPDPLLAQVLAASTYPLELIQLQQWLVKNKGVTDKALADAVAKESWDPSVQALAALPEVVDRLANDIQWTADLGNAFLSQQSDVMQAVQRMRKKAQDKGTLKSTEQQTVETKVIQSEPVIVIQQANPKVVYVPSYDPLVVWGAPYYPYPPIYYPPAGYYAAGLAISFGVGVAMGAFWSGGWGWGCGWGGNNDITVNRNNNFNRNASVGGGNRISNRPGGGNGIGQGNRPSNLPAGGTGIGQGNRASTLPAGGAGNASNRWQHNPEHRGGAPYRDRATADRFGGSARGDSLANRQANARQQLSRQGGNLASTRSGSGGMGGGGLNRAGGPDRIGSRDLSRSGAGNRGAFGGGSKGYNGSNARASGSRGSSSMGSRSGGFSRGGGGSRGGGRRR